MEYMVGRAVATAGDSYISCSLEVTKNAKHCSTMLSGQLLEVSNELAGDECGSTGEVKQHSDDLCVV
jgi:hypothetical protein